MKPFLIILIFLLTNLNSFSQVSEFDSIYRETAQNLISSDPEGALYNVDYLYKISENNSEKLKSLLLKATLLSSYGINDEAINILLDAEQIAEREKDFVSLTRIYGFASTIYRETKLNAPSIKYLEKAKESSKKVEDVNLQFRLQGNLEQEAAHIEMQKKNHQKAIEHAHKSNELFLKVASTIDIPYHLSINSGIIAKNYLAMKETDSALFYFENAQENLAKSQYANSPMKAFIFLGIAETYIETKFYDQAEEYLFNTKQIADESNFFQLKKEVYQMLSNFYKELNQTDQYLDFNEQYMQLINDDENSRKLIADKLIERLYIEESNAIITNHQKKNIIIALVIFTILLSTLLAWYIYNKKQNKKKFSAFIEEKNKHQNIIQKKPIVNESQEDKNYMSEEKELEILEKLAKIEKTKFYLDEDISLSVLSGKIGVNQRYLTHVIKKHKEIDFANYINELRINYIVDCLKNNPEYLMYKISYLAEKCGFASHSRFTVNFKKVTGITPSTFINYIREENEKDQKKV